VSRATTLLRRVPDPWPEQDRLDVPVTEAIDLVLATQHGAEQRLLLRAEQIQAAAAALAQMGRLVHPVKDLQAGLRPIHDRQGVEVTVVGRARDLVVVVEVGHALVHGTPVHLASPLALDPAADLELARVVDDRLDA
jgi:hypothetical protein